MSVSIYMAHYRTVPLLRSILAQVRQVELYNNELIASNMVGGVAQWLGRRSLASGLS